VSASRLSAFEQRVVARLAPQAGLAASLLDAWARLPPTSAQTVRALIDAAQLGVTEERAAAEVLRTAVSLGLLVESARGFMPAAAVHDAFGRLALILNSIQHYLTAVHQDQTRVQVVITRPPRPSVLEQKLSDLGWRTADLEATNHAFKDLVRRARQRLVVMTPFFDVTGAAWLQELFAETREGVQRTLVLRSLEDGSRGDYPVGYNSIAHWLRQKAVEVFNYSIARAESTGRETFHAKVVLCDTSAAYIGSSNVNAASLAHSMEVGVVLEGRAAGEVALIVEAVLKAAHVYR
jgi:phosphatidylserine/phosphatidylglycerophosphate/cardiolipin synthase-like enzyme